MPQITAVQVLPAPVSSPVDLQAPAQQVFQPSEAGHFAARPLEEAPLPLELPDLLSEGVEVAFPPA